MKNTSINITSLKRLLPSSSKTVTHLCKCAARAYGKIALREQLDYETATDKFSSFEMVDTDREELKQEIIALVNDCCKTLYRLNGVARRLGIPEPLPAVNEMNLTARIAAVDEYVTTLVSESDYKMWLDETLTR